MRELASASRAEQRREDGGAARAEQRLSNVTFAASWNKDEFDDASDPSSSAQVARGDVNEGSSYSIIEATVTCLLSFLAGQTPCPVVAHGSKHSPQGPLLSGRACAHLR